ncbi:MAG: SoxR reducing system RseC family protein [Bacteroidaceae bacterium]|nr:SoxR reducing system RseC family protein [Bacteroidaceae bacterium]
MDEKIEHQGVVEEVSREYVRVTIVQVAACAECKAKSLCVSSESKKKVIEVKGSYPDLKVGDAVKVCGSMQMGRRAVLLAFTLPMVMLLLIGFVCLGILNMSEGWVMLLMLLSLTVYFSVMYVLRSRIEREFRFWIENSNL